MTSTVFTPLKNAIVWTDPTTNVDGSAIAAGEITGFTLGVRADGDAAHSAGNYQYSVAVSGATATEETLAALAAAIKLNPGNYWAAVQTTGPTDSAWSGEAPFSIPTPPPVPNPPTGLSVS